jgi:hypothetical protein
MTDAILTHDAGVAAFADAGGVVSTDDDQVSFNWDESHVVTVDAPADLQGAFDTDEFYKIEGATIARPIKQTYVVGDSVEQYKKPADALRQAAWSFDNAPFTLGHPDSGMVKDVDDVHGFWRNPRYDDADDRLKEDLYIPTTDEEALEFIEEHSDVSVGFYNRVATEFDGDTGDLTDDDVDGFQVQMYGDHIAGVERGRCSSEEGCGLDNERHGSVLTGDASTSFVSQEAMTNPDFPEWETGDMVEWQVNPSMYGEIVATDEGRKIVMVELMEGGEESGYTLTAGYTDLRKWSGATTDASQGEWVEWDTSGGTAYGKIDNVVRDGCTTRGKGSQEVCADEDDPAVEVEVYDDEVGESKDEIVRHKASELRSWSGPSNDSACRCSPTTDAPDGLYTEDDNWYGIAPSETGDDEPKYELDNCNDVKDAWNLRGSGDYTVEQSTLESRIKRAADAHDCPPEQKPWTEDNTMDDFDIPDLSVDAIAEQNDSVSDLRAERDELESTIDEMREDITDAFDEADHFTVELDEDECVCDAVSDLVADLDEKAAKVEQLEDDLEEYRADERDEALDELEGFGADRDEWDDESLGAIEEELKRRKEVADAVEGGTSVKGTEDSGEDSTDESSHGSRTLARGYNA